MNICVVGTGYVGLVTGACLAESGNNVICVDIDEGKIRSLSQGIVPFFEPGLDDLVQKNLKEGRLHFTTNLSEAVQRSFIIFIAVGTPPDGDGSADVSAVLDVARSIGKSMNDYKIVVTKSTVPVGTTEKVREVIRSVTDIEFDVASNPEFLKEGAAVEDFMKPDRVVIGADKPSVAGILKELYSPFMRSGDRAIIASIRSAELAKYAANAMLATRISFMNEMANLCELVGADVSEIRLIIGADSRIGRSFLFPGIGYGGSCFPKDIKALIKTAERMGYELKICKATDEVNTNQREIFWNKIKTFFRGNLSGKRIGVWGLSFKPKTDDLREAPSLFIVNRLISHGAEVVVHDPVAMGRAREYFGDKVRYAESNYDACVDAHALVIHTEWNEYRQPDFDTLKKIMRIPVIFDGRNLYDPKKLERLGFKYFGVGVSNSIPVD
ncbi:UDP-glucose 6-dehydrogenase TuaD [bacterium HR37]|nr:UDP-glucose 6-dehydrogenase TuaD [bacterium HR37]